MADFHLLDTTLRDGSYSNNFSFTLDDTFSIVRALDVAGIGFVEVGHGVGLNASAAGHGDALHSDVEYASVAATAAKKSKVGVFCISEIANEDNVSAVADVGIDFVRVGSNVDAVKSSERMIKHCRSRGLRVFANYMKSYAMPPREFAEQVCRSEDYGAEAVYIVDSAGGMFDKQIQEYFDAIRARTNIEIGFHGHNNLGLAVSNSLYSVDIGVKYVDVSLQGLGRSAGNTPAETFVACLNKKGVYTSVDFLKLVDISMKFIIPARTRSLLHPLDVVSGFADFHSSYMRDIQQVSALYSVNPLELIIEYCKYDKVEMDRKKLNEIAASMRHGHSVRSDVYDFCGYYGHEQN